MYILEHADSFEFSGAPYLLDIILTQAGLAIINDQGLLSLFDPRSLRTGPCKTFRTGQAGVQILREYQQEESIVCTADASGKVCIWDLRVNPALPTVTLSDSTTGIQALACASSSHSIAAGTDFENHQASVLLWDMRNPGAPRTKYSDVHSDDITELRFNPSQSHLLLSGSTDGLVNILDITNSDEEEVIVQTFNHNASIHRAGFLNEKELFALSHDEKFALYSTADYIERGVAIQSFGDMRSTLQCQYVANVFPKMNGAGAIIGAGESEQKIFGLVHLGRDNQGKWSLDLESSVGLAGAHGEEIVRSFCFLDQQQIVFSVGEDGCVKSWQPQ